MHLLSLKEVFVDAFYSSPHRTSYQYSKPHSQQQQQQQQQQQNQNQKQESNAGQIQSAKELFSRVPVLGASFVEVISFQSLTNILNLCFIAKLGESILDDSERAGWNGKFYGMVNGSSALLQFLILPLFLHRVSIRSVWRYIPILPLSCVIIQCFYNKGDPTLMIVATALFVVKTIDYTFRNVINEMIYVDLDFESRYLGKEIIGVFGNRLGKSGTSLLLLLLPYGFDTFGVREFTRLSVIATTVWSYSAFRLSNLVGIGSNSTLEKGSDDIISNSSKSIDNNTTKEKKAYGKKNK